MTSFRHLLIIAFLASTLNNVLGQEKNKPLTGKNKIETIKSIGNVINNNYIFPKVSSKIVNLLNNKLKKGEYDKITNPLTFAEKLTKDVQSFNQDKHLRVFYEPKRIAKKDKIINKKEILESEKEYIKSLKKNNYFFKEVKILDGNIGYLDFRRFRDPEYGVETIVSAMGFLNNSDAIIIDLRNNGGGSPNMVQFIASYFFKDNSTQLSSIYKRKKNITKQYWTLPHIPGKRIPDVPLYILTSNNTFSAAEAFSYDLKHLKRAIVIGETTAGGAHPGGRIKATDKFNVWTPTARSINPITKTNWEGTGVEPNIKIASNQALSKAHIAALKLLKNKNIDKKSKAYYNWVIQTLKTKENPTKISLSVLKKYQGTYGIRIISLENKNLYYKRGNSPKHKLIPINNNTFMFEEFSDFRIQFVKNKNKVTAIKGINQDGSVSRYNRTKK